METFKFEWMNGGQPFDLTTARITPAAYKACILAKSHTLIEHTKGLDGVPKEVRDIVMADATTAAAMAQANALLYHTLCGIDPKVKDVPLGTVIDRLGASYNAMAAALTSNLRVDAKEAHPNGLLQPT